MRSLLILMPLLWSAAAFGASCKLPASTKVPDWIDNPTAQDEQNYYGYGVIEAAGTSLNDARKLARSNARQELAESLVSHVVSDVLINNTLSDDSSKVKRQVESSVRAHTDMLLQGAEVSQYYYDRDNCFAWVKLKLDKQQYQNSEQYVHKSVLTSVNEQLAQLAKGQQQQQQSLDEIKANTRKGAHELLASEYGISDVDIYTFHQALFAYETEELKQVLALFKQAKFDPDAYARTNPDCLGTVQMYQKQSVQEAALKLFYMPQIASPAACAVFSGIDAAKFELVIDIFELSPEHVTDASDYYMTQANNHRYIPTERAGSNPFTPLALHESYNYSLISYLQDSRGELSNRRGNYSLMHFAAAMNRPDLMTLLLSKGWTLDKLTAAGYTPVALAFEHESIEFIEAAIAAGYQGDRTGVDFQIGMLKAFEKSSQYFRLAPYPDVRITDNSIADLAKRFTPKNKQTKSKTINELTRFYQAGIDVGIEAYTAMGYSNKDALKQFSTSRDYINVLRKM